MKLYKLVAFVFVLSYCAFQMTGWFHNQEVDIFGISDSVSEQVEKTIEKPRTVQKMTNVVDSIIVKAVGANLIENNSKSSEPVKNQPCWKFVKPPNIFDDDNIGAMGKGVTMPSILSADIQKLYDDGWINHQFNQYLSDLISVNRTLPDYRTDYCKEIVANYTKTLPATSVIIIFHNEAWSTLLRTVHSVLNRSPTHLITEIILVDDFSTMGEI